MAEHYIGLDIGSFAVRAAEISGEPGNWTLHRFAQLTLPPNAVVDGEILDSAAVTTAIRQLWQRGDFKSKKVTVGIANRWVKVRQAEVPALSPAEVRTSLRYQSQEVIPFAPEDAIVDYVVQDHFTSPEGGESLHILVVAAQRQMVTTTLDTVRRAGLNPTRVDLTPFALLRALVPEESPGISEAIISVGAGLTNVIVHTAGVPKLVRMTPRAGAMVTENLTRVMGIPSAQAEALKRGSAVALADPMTDRAAGVIAGELGPLVQEIRGSLDYFASQDTDVDLRRMLLTGAGTKMAGLRSRLATELRVPVEMASPLEYLHLGKTGLTDEQLAAAAAGMAAPVGLAMAALANPATRLTTLFPAHYAAEGKERTARLVTGAAVAGLAAVLLGGWGVRHTSVVSARATVERSTARVAALDTQVARLAPLQQVQTAIEGQRAAAVTALATDVDMPVLLDTLTAKMPADVGLTTLNVSVTPAVAASAPGASGVATAAPVAFGAVSVGAVGTSHASTARWITSMRELGILSNLWVPSSNALDGVTFNSTADISPTAKSTRANEFKAAPA